MKLDNYRLKLGGKEYVPIMIGGMGVNISTSRLALEAARLGGIGHISDAEICAVADSEFGTSFVKEKRNQYSAFSNDSNKSKVQFDLAAIEAAQKLYVSKTMEAKKGSGAVFINCMEKLLMNNPAETLRTRLHAAMSAGIDGITLSAGLHMRSLELMKDHPRFHDVMIGIVVSSTRALKIFLHRAVRLNRLPDFIVVEGPLAGGHLGFDIHDLDKYSLKDIVLETISFLQKEGLSIPIIPAGGVFTGSDGAEYLEAGASAVQVATRFTIAEEAGLPEHVKQAYLATAKEDVIVNMVSPTGYPMRMLKQSPALQTSMKPNCEALGYILDGEGKCDYIKEYEEALKANPGEKPKVTTKFCLCTNMQQYNCWTCGALVYRLKETTNRLADGSYQIPTTEDIFLDYQYSDNHSIHLPNPIGQEVIRKASSA
ncbi:2-nitropropane dioxygenase NPD [Chloroherpeton thalassium ATCC 35110]|uniref:2-nitropropane dioxygenase NPD n=1 Tax=Chloroherpeton thalassium (strain ATCC 35110 / GB-78) TaxID=517418 RepID=B3QVK9_CHLT3|nr:nitronate monooxygenase [Chloroherpeton thalassium]ACF14609.1 2-nitropropane dioxygenase NPD [Chloroherpeton thalassium ATCC 35110]